MKWPTVFWALIIWHSICKRNLRRAYAQISIVTLRLLPIHLSPFIQQCDSCVRPTLYEETNVSSVSRKHSHRSFDLGALRQQIGCFDPTSDHEKKKTWLKPLPLQAAPSPPLPRSSPQTKRPRRSPGAWPRSPRRSPRAPGWSRAAGSPRSCWCP